MYDLTYFASYKMSIKGLTLILALLLPAVIQAQQVQENACADSLVAKHKKLAAMKRTMPGYRVQLYFGSERLKASDLKTAFQLEFPMVPAYVVYQQPNFKLRVGDFKNRLEAVALLKKLEGRYGSAFIVPDEVRLPDF